MRVALLAVTSAALLLGLCTSSASAAVPTWTNACASDPNPAACERLTFLAETADSSGSDLAAIRAKLEEPAPPPDPISGTVALSGDDAQTATLGAWGVWFLGGVVLVGLFAAKFHGSFRFWRD